MRRNPKSLRNLLAACLFVAAAALPIAPAGAALLGIDGADLLFPVVQYDAGGTTTYNAATDTFAVDATPLGVQFMPGPPRSVLADGVLGRSVKIRIQVDASGALVGGSPGDDFEMIGSIDQDFPPDGTAEYTGVLLRGEIVAFGFVNSATPTDIYDFRFRVTGGSLAPLFAGSDIGVILDSETSSFDGTFNANFGGKAKGSIARISTLCIDIEKQISVDGGATYADADQPGDPDVPTVNFPSGAKYRLIIENCGTTKLNGVVINDPKLGLSGVQIGNGMLDPQQSVVLDMSDLPQLQVDEVCDSAGTFICATSVRGTSSQTTETVQDSDPATLICRGQPLVKLSLKKQISLDGGLNWADADAVGDPDVPVLTAPAGVLYRLIVKNDGEVDLENVTVEDMDLGIPAFFVGDLGVGQSKTIGSGEIPGLKVPVRCDVAGVFINVAKAMGEANETGAQVSDTDPAVLRCVVEECSLDVVKTCLEDDGPDGGPDKKKKKKASDGKKKATKSKKAGSTKTKKATSTYSRSSTTTNGSKKKSSKKKSAKKKTPGHPDDPHDPGSDLCELKGAGEVTYRYVITNTGDAAVKVTSVLDDKLGEQLPAPAALPVGESLTLEKSAIIGATTVNKVLVTATPDPDGAACRAMDEAKVVVLPPPVCGCADGKPGSLVFRYTGKSCDLPPTDPATNTQSGKFTCTGNPNMQQPVQVVASGLGVSPSSQTVNVGDLVTIGLNEKFPSQTGIWIKKHGKAIQDLSIHTSCSKPLAVGDRFGSLTLVEFIPLDADQGMCKPGGGEGKKKKAKSKKSSSKKKKH